MAFEEFVSIGGIIGLLINVIVITVILAASNKILAHEMSIRNSFIMALIAYLVVPILLAFANISFPYAFYLLPLVIWIGLGEALLKGTRKSRLTVAAVAFIVYLILTFMGVPGIIAGLIGF